MERKIGQSYLRKVIKEGLKKALNEISTDTLWSAQKKAYRKYKVYYDKFGPNDPRTLKAREQYDNFKYAWDNEYISGNNNRKARMLKNSDNIDSGKRSYISGIGWRDKMSESYLHDVIVESMKHVINESNELYDEWYQQEDYNGQYGEPGMIKSYDIGTYYISQAEQDAQECGYDNVEDYLKYWFDEIQQECPWYWTKIGDGYGYNGTTIFKNGGIVCKNIFDQIIVDEYPI